MPKKNNPHLDLAYTMIQKRSDALAPAMPPEYCDQQTENELYDAGLAYLYASNEQVAAMRANRQPNFTHAKDHWPWRGDPMRILAGPVQNLAQAGAFFSADAERLARLKANNEEAHHVVCQRVRQVAAMIAEHLANPGLPRPTSKASAERPWLLILAIAMLGAAIAYQVLRSVFFPSLP